ncbi:MAG: M15 family metallopeptidase [Thermomicrobiales bacterium]|nr:M15 family metallopeptidase [Thermomicrobiales bacterium]MCO5220267.1 M15 family metallopeptidase [Thermomicrobiales bacterium]
MRHTAPSGTKIRNTLRFTAVAVVVMTAGIAGTLAYHSASSTTPLLGDVLRSDGTGMTTEAPPVQDRPGAPPREDGDPGDAEDDGARAVTRDDGLLPDGVTVFDNNYPGVTNLDPDLLRALRRAATDAADGGIAFYVTSGWRSPEYQNQLLHEAIAEYGSEEEAARWVATANTSAHVSGDAVDIGPSDAMAWLSEYGAAYGLCQIYGNEPWHFELRPEAIERGCPPMYADPTEDPRMQP